MAFYSESCGIHLRRNIDRQDSTINKQTNKQTKETRGMELSSQVKLNPAVFQNSLL